MKIREIMDCFFSICSLGDTVEEVIKKIQIKQTSSILVVDKNNKYMGVVTVLSLLDYKNKKDQIIDSFVQQVDPVLGNEEIRSLKNIVSDIVPVINSERNIVGVINLKSMIEYIPERILKYEGNYSNKNKINLRRRPKYTIDDIIGESKTILQLKERILGAAKTKSTVLIMGETGTGKELVAHAITNLSRRRHQPFVRINCAAIPENLLESELFGYEQGAFTGALKSGSSGKFEMANDGTIFLDEIGDMQLSLQAKILRVLQEREIEKIGGHFPIPIDVRVIAATHADLPELVKTNKFRQDLFYRLHVIPIYMPPLRTHIEDIPLLAEHFAIKISNDLKIKVPKIEKSFIKKLMEYDWPGNIRELVNVIEMAVSFSNDVINCDHIPMHILREIEQTKHLDNSNSLRLSTDDIEREVIMTALEEYRGNKIKAAKHLGISRSNLYYKMKKLNIKI